MLLTAPQVKPTQSLLEYCALLNARLGLRSVPSLNVHWLNVIQERMNDILKDSSTFLRNLSGGKS